MLTFGSLFAGIGGFDLGFTRAGLDCAWQVENNPFCQKVLLKNFPGVPLYGEIQNVETDFLDPVDVICGGFPCQDISLAKTWTTSGKHSVEGINGTRSGLWKEYLRVVAAVRPWWVVGENSKVLASKGLDVGVQDLAEIGYDTEWTTLPASLFGAPHFRERLFFVAYPDGERRMETPFFYGAFAGETIRHASQWESSRTVRQADGKKTLPESFGIHDGLPAGLYRAERMAALGNAVVPQIAEWIGRRILALDTRILTLDTDHEIA